MLILMLVGVAFASTGFSPRSDEAAKTQQQVPAKGTDFKVIQEIPVTGGSMVMPDMMVKGDGSLVVYIVQLAEETLEYAAMANTTRLTNSLLESAKQLRAKNGDTRIPVEAEAYRLTMIQDLAVSPYAKGLFDGKGAVGVEGGWEWVAYSAMTAGAGAFVLVNELKAPNYPPAMFVPGAFPSFWYGGPAGTKIAYWAQEGKNIKLMLAAERIAVLEEGTVPVAPAIFKRGPKSYATESGMIYVASTANRRALFADTAKVRGDCDAIEAALNPLMWKVGYIARNGGQSVLVVDGKEQATGFVPVHGLTFFAGGNACAFAAGTGAREFVVRNSLKALSSFTRVTPDKDFGEVRSLAFNSLTTKVAYVAKDGRKEWVMIDDQKVTPEYTLVSFNREGFEWGGPLVFAGYDAAKDVIVVGRL
jgi:hypothetical protein